MKKQLLTTHLGALSMRLVGGEDLDLIGLEVGGDVVPVVNRADLAKAQEAMREHDGVLGLGVIGGRVYRSRGECGDGEEQGSRPLPQIKKIQAFTGTAKVSLIRHGHGGQSLRYVAGVAPERVASVTDVSTAIKGTPVADVVYAPAEILTELSGVHDLAVGDVPAIGTPAGSALTVPSPAKRRIAALLPEAVKWKAFMKTQEGRSDYYLKKGHVFEASIRSADGVIDLGVQHDVVVEQA